MKKKLPAFGNALLERRRTGEVPLCVHLIYGLQWRAPCECAWSRAIREEHPLLALKPLDFRPGLYDWRIVTGVYVAVFDQGHEPVDNADAGPPRPWWCERLYALVGELGVYAAEVEVYRDGNRSTAGELVESARLSARNNGWPHWWSAEHNERYAHRFGTWIAAVSAGRLAA